jgi:PAS domain S-box-containing protein
MNQPILIVDDSLTVRMDLSETLVAAGLAVVTCETGETARHALREREFSLVILDVLLPDVDGIDILKEIRGTPATRALPIMLLSTEAEVHDRIRGIETGADEYIGKPYDSSYVAARARELVQARKEDTSVSETVLIIDDSITFREALKQVLEEASYKVVVATTGEEGLRLAAQTRPMAILVDRMLPGIDGGAVVRRIRFDAALRHVPCLLLTSSDEREAEIWALETGADAFVRKDEDASIILAKFRAVLRSAARHTREHTSTTLLTTKKLLAVDDSETFLQTLAEVLRAEGYDVAIARSGEEAIALLAVQPVDCVLLDVMMPGMDGQETCRRLKASPETREIPVVMLTANEDRTTMIQGLDMGADDFIAKSSDFSVVRARVAAQLRRRQFEDENRAYRQELQRKELEAAEARAARELAEVRARLVEELEAKVVERTAALRDSEQRFRDIAEISGDWLWETDAGHSFTYIGGAETSSAEDFSGKGMGKALWQLSGIDIPSDAWEEHRADLDARRPFRNFRCSMTDGDGEPLYLSISGKPVFDLAGVFQGYRGTITNETAIFEALSRTRAAEAKLRDAVDRLDAAFDASPAAIIALDVKGRVLLWNRAARLTYGWAEEEIIGEPFTMIPRDERDRAVGLFRRSMSGESFSDAESVHLTKGGRRIDVMLAGAPLRDAGGVQIGTLFMVNDVTEKRLTEQQLRQAQKMEAVGQLTGGVAHDFNNILMVILSNVEELLEDASLTADQRELLTTISDSGERAAEMTRRLLAFSRKQRLAPQPTNLTDLVSGVDKLLRRTLGEQIEIEAIFADDLWMTNVDRSQVEAALVNLCVNARDAMPDGGRLVIETLNAELDADYAAANAGVIPGSYVVLGVSDTGTGISADVLDKVFEPFFTTKEAGKGTGLGLSMVYGFVKQSNGHINIYSEVGHGTTIRIYLPRSDAVPVESERAMPSMPRGRERILLVEDQEDVRASILRQLRSLGYHVTEAASGTLALDCLESGNTFDLLLTDVIMPALDGPALAERVRARWPQIKVLFMSGYSENAARLQGFVAPSKKILSKPFRKFELACRVREELDA